MDNIISYIVNKYEPSAIILYGSYANGSNNENSDFDALIITDKKGQAKAHDSSVIDDVILDIFIYNTSDFEKEINYDKFVQIYDGKIILDKFGVAHSLKNKVISHIESTPFKSDKENLVQIEWCEKMLLRTERNDIEGYYRWHWLLMDSLEIYFDIQKWRYFGPKKALKRLALENSNDAALYLNALSSMDITALKKWIYVLRDRFQDK